jgi:hypothetical protein
LFYYFIKKKEKETERERVSYLKEIKQKTIRKHKQKKTNKKNANSTVATAKKKFFLLGSSNIL